MEPNVAGAQSETEWVQNELAGAPADDDSALRAALCKRWKQEIEQAQNYFKRWREQADKVAKLRVDVRGDDAAKLEGEACDYRRMNVFWSNVEVQLSAYYQQTPNPQGVRRFKDKDLIGKTAAELIERVVDYFCQPEDVDPVIEEGVTDWLEVGRGSPPWVYYEVEETAGPNGAARIGWERLQLDYVPWEDYIECPARRKKDVWWKGRALYLSKEDLVKRFGQWGEQAKLDHTSLNDDSKRSEDDPLLSQMFSFGKVWEIHDRKNRMTIWLQENGDYALGYQQDALGLADYFPCGDPIFANTYPKSRIPIPDYAIYQDQARYIDTLTTRIEVLTDALRVRAVASEEFKEVQSFLNADDGEVVFLPNWDRFVEAGGLEGVMQMGQIDVLSRVLQVLIELRKVALDNLYEVFGIPDIVRGVADPQNAEGTNQLLNANANVRFRRRRKLVERYCRDAISVMGEIVAKKFQPETIAKIAGIDWIEVPNATQLPPEQIQQARMQVFQQAIELLRNDQMRSYKIDVETDSTVEADTQREQQEFNEFAQIFGTIIEQAQAAVAAAPELSTVIGELLLAGVRRYRGGRHLENALEDAVNAIEQRIKAQAEQPQQPPEDPVITELRNKLQADLAKIQADAQVNTERQRTEQIKLQQAHEDKLAQMEQTERLKYEEMALKLQDIETRLQIEMAKLGAQNERDYRKDLAELVKYRDELQRKAEAERDSVMRESERQATNQPVAYRFRTDVDGSEIAEPLVNGGQSEGL